MPTVSPLIQNLNLRVVRHVTLPLLKIEEGRPYYVKITGKIFQAEQVKNPKKTQVKNADGTVTEIVQAPPFVVHVDNLETGHPAQMIANEVLKTELERTYKDGGYVGKVFELIKNTKAEGKNYNTFGITEMEVETADAGSEAPKVSGKAK